MDRYMKPFTRSPLEIFWKLLSILEAKGEVTSTAKKIIYGCFHDLVEQLDWQSYNEGYNDAMQAELELEEMLEGEE